MITPPLSSRCVRCGARRPAVVPVGGRETAVLLSVGASAKAARALHTLERKAECGSPLARSTSRGWWGREGPIALPQCEGPVGRTWDGVDWRFEPKRAGPLALDNTGGPVRSRTLTRAGESASLPSGQESVSLPCRRESASLPPDFRFGPWLNSLAVMLRWRFGLVACGVRGDTAGRP